MSREAVAFIAGSPDHRRLLDLLADEPATPRDVADALDVASRSAQRNLSALADRGWVERRDGAYHLTTTGYLVRDAYADCLETLDAVAAFETFYAHFPDPDLAPDPGWLTDATYVAADRDHPDAPVDHYVRAIRSTDTDRVRMVAPVLSRLFHGPHAEQVVGGATTELVMPTGKVAAAREKNPLEFRTVVAVPRFTLYRTDDPVAFGVTLTDERTFVLAYDDGRLRACVDGADPALREWAVDRFEALRADATEVEGPSGLF